MKISLFILSTLLISTVLFAQAPVVTNIQCHQQTYPSKIVEITYDLEAVTETVDIRVLISDDGGESWDVPIETFEGDIGADIQVSPGKRILWDAGEDFPEHVVDDMKARVIADDGIGLAPGTERRFELVNGVDIVMCWIPPGEFDMGSPDNEQGRSDDEDPVHRVRISRGFWMGKYEVTQAQWSAAMGNNPARRYGVGDNYPVYYVSWRDILRFRGRINAGFRMPSESEWEYACRAGTTTSFYWGQDFDNRYAVYSGNAPNGIARVGTKRPNPWGLYDMSGNVYEWCRDRYHGTYRGAPNDGRAWTDGALGRILRGGAWTTGIWNCRSADRYHSEENNPWYRYQGFRLVRNAE
jgi:formylglycine-generating enzyme required for sulfatase activity